MAHTQPPKIFEPLQVGGMTLSHRIIMSPLTRIRCPNSLPDALVAEYYAQRTTPGGLIIGEGTHPSIMAGNFLNVPGMFTLEHVQAWKLVTDAVHAKGGFIVCQLWHVGRFAVAVQLGGREPLSSSATNIGLSNRFTPKGRVPTEKSKEMTPSEIQTTIDEHVHAAKCALEAGFDAVEITMGNGYLCDQFLNSGVNLRADKYGGSIENRARFPLELLDAVIAAIQPSKTAVRFSPWGTVLMPLDSDPISTFSYVLSEVEKRGLAYVCLTQPRTDLFLPEETKWENLHHASDIGAIKAIKDEITLKPFFKILRTTPAFATGGYDDKNCFEEVESGELNAVTFGRWFISNPDLVDRIRMGKSLTPWKQESFYADGAWGYTDYPSADIEVDA
ncbi:12-oxophytodienoate-10 [Hyphodiscus hymeniophilus]|uniref:12-oxophytodienoate-10 n=1 Tax=Hyphodiscus hymeniophilus TaxID=353542 RepID=A0A9P6SLT3_9HELO|nr:12-oxophytodienoate-10 [Hyphodiscus hymeniophilus]